MRRFILVLFVLVPVVCLGVGLAGDRVPDGEAQAEGMLEEQLATWNDPVARDAQRASLRRYNPEWDFMQRTFLLLSLADAALVQPERQDELLKVMDDILEETLADEAAHGHRHDLVCRAGGAVGFIVRVAAGPDGQAVEVAAGALALLRHELHHGTQPCARLVADLLGQVP